jgi:hypothetical protein
MAENKDMQGPKQVQSDGMTGNDGSKGNKDAGQTSPGNFQGSASGQHQAGDEALEGNTGAGGSNGNTGAGGETEGGSGGGTAENSDATTQGHDSDGNTGIMTNDDLEKDDVAGGGSSLRE